jgi:hypothetical protein
MSEHALELAHKMTEKSAVRDACTSNPLLVVCCCGGLPFLGMIKSLILFIPTTLIFWPACTVIALILLPYDVWFTYYTLFKTRTIGINLKILGFLLLPISLVLWPFFVCVAALCLGLGYGFCAPVFKTFTGDGNLIVTGTYSVLVDACDYVKYFWEFELNSVYAYLLELRERPCDNPFDIHILELILSVLVSLVAVFVDGICIGIMAIIKFIPAVFRSYYLFWKYFSSVFGVWFFVWLPTVLVGNVLFPPFAFLVLLVVIIGGFFSGIYSGVVCYSEGFVKSLHQIWQTVVMADVWSNVYIFAYEKSVFDLCQTSTTV